MISSVSVTNNDEDNIKAHLMSLGIATEHLIIDVNSTDNTATIAKQLNAKVFSSGNDSIVELKNLALSQTANSWILSFEPYETIPQALALEIQSMLTLNPKEAAFKVRRNFYFMGKRMRYATDESKPVVRVFKKSGVVYGGDLGKEILGIHGVTKTLENKLDYSYQSFDDFNKKLTWESRQEAVGLYKQNIRPQFYHFILKPFTTFFYHYLFNLGVLDGKEGFILAYLKAFAVMKTHLFLWTMYREID